MKRFLLLGLIVTMTMVFLFVLAGVSSSIARPETTIVVNSTADAVPGTLRQALLDAVNVVMI